jgi:O-antigen ligase
VLAGYVLYGFLGQVSLGAGPARSAGATAAGDAANQVVSIMLLAATVPLLLARPRAVAALVPACFSLLIVIAWFAASASWSLFPQITVRRVVVIAIAAVIFFAVVITLDQPRRLVSAITALLVVIIFMDLLALVLYPGVAAQRDGVQGIHAHKNVAGGVGMVAFLACAGLAFASRGLPRLGAALAALATFFFIVLTQSKTSLAFTVLLATTAPLGYLIMVRSRALFATGVLAICSAAAFVVLVLALAEVSTDDVLELLFGDPTLTQRTELWHHLAYSVRDRPVFGVGWGAFWDVGLKVNPIRGVSSQWFMDATLINSAHNGYLEVLLQSGLIGLALVMVLIARLLFVYLGLLANPRLPRADRPLVATFLVIAVAILLNNVMESRFFGSRDPIARIFELTYICGEWWRLRLRARPPGTPYAL